jgi:hypothetical protein
MAQEEQDDVVYMEEPVKRSVSHLGLLVSHKTKGWGRRGDQVQEQGKIE